MRHALAILLLTVAAPAVAQTSTSTFSLHGVLAGRGIYVKSQPSWMEGGVGRFDVGADNSDDSRTVNVDVAQLGFDWTPLSWLSFHADGLARHEPAHDAGRSAGLVQAYADLYTEHLSLRAGSFWLPTSRENVDPLWNSRYTITYSALNTWIAQEVRPIGVDLQFSPNFYITAGATAFRGNDTMGTELSYRGWAFGNRISVYGEPLPTPEDGETTKPIWKDLDKENGYAERLRLQLPERAMIQFTHVDNRAKLIPRIDDQTPWRTKFNLIGGSIGASGPTTVAAEWMAGSTAVGFPGGSYTMDFDTGYVLFSQKQGTERWTIRGERFTTKSAKSRPNDSARESGHAITLAWFHDSGKNVRTGFEYCRVKGDRPGVASAGFDPKTGGSTMTLEVRYAF
jgi:hypothetical protein